MAKKYLYKHDFLKLLEHKQFEKEEQLRDCLSNELPSLLKITKDQIIVEPLTTSFDFTLSNRADILIKTRGEYDKVVMVIECKLSKSMERFCGDDYTDATKQLHKYCQDVRAPYGLLISENFCAIWKYKYFQYDRSPERVKDNKMPEINVIVEEMATTSLIDVVAHPKTIKYIYLFFFIAFAIGYVANLVSLYLKPVMSPIFIIISIPFILISIIMLVKDIRE